MTRGRAIAVAVLFLIAGGLYLGASRILPAIRAPFFPPPEDITGAIPGNDGDDAPSSTNETGMPLHLPDGFSISIFAKNLGGARVMAWDRFSNLWVSRTNTGAVTLLEIGEDGVVANQSDIFTGLQKPHGLAFSSGDGVTLYIAEEHQVLRVGTYSEDRGTPVLALPFGGGHYTRTVGFGPNGKLYISAGSSCNVCEETDERRAAILELDPASGTSRIFARGLRNSVFFIWDENGRMFATDMGRDWLGDNLPPDEVNRIEDGKFYGWPICYGKNIHDTDFDKKTYIRNPCMEPSETASVIDIPAHSAPLGLQFIPKGKGWPAAYEGDLLVAYHGSWNRSAPTGYTVVRFDVDAKGNFSGGLGEDFITGWIQSDGALGRPVGLLFGVDGALYISDDKAGVIYQIRPPGHG